MGALSPIRPINTISVPLHSLNFYHECFFQGYLGLNPLAFYKLFPSRQMRSIIEKSGTRSRSAYTDNFYQTVPTIPYVPVLSSIVSNLVHA